VLSHLQLDGEGGRAARAEVSCGAQARRGSGFRVLHRSNVLKTPQIALLAFDIMDALSVTYRVMGRFVSCAVDRCRVHAPAQLGRR
jgi:heterodisulfide reductase subunit D